MRVGVFLHGTTMMHRSALGHSREERVRRVQHADPAVRDYASYVPVGNAADKLGTWRKQGAEIVYVSSHRRPEQVEQDRAVLERYHFPNGQVILRGPGETYQDMAERGLPAILIEDDCDSIGGQHEMISPDLRSELHARITSIVVREFEGIDHLPDDLAALKSWKMKPE